MPPATPTMYPAIETAVWLASDSDRWATARPPSTMLPVMTLVKTPPSRVKLATSVAPDPKVSAIAISVRICCLAWYSSPDSRSPPAASRQTGQDVGTRKQHRQTSTR